MKTGTKSRDAPPFSGLFWCISFLFISLSTFLFSVAEPTASIKVSEYFYDKVSGRHLNGRLPVKASILSGTNVLFTETKAQTIMFQSGGFNLSIDDIPISVFQAPDIYLQLNVNEKIATFSFRSRPYSIHSQLAETASHVDASKITGTFESTVSINQSLMVHDTLAVSVKQPLSTQSKTSFAQISPGQFNVQATVNVNELYMRQKPFYEHLSWKKATQPNAIYTEKQVGINAIKPFYDLHVYDDIINATEFLINGTNINPNIYWVLSDTPPSSNTYTESGNIGIGTAFPKAKLDVNGPVRMYTSAPLISGSIRWAAVKNFKEFQMATEVLDETGAPTVNWQSTTGISGLGLSNRLGYWTERNQRTELNYIPNLYADFEKGYLSFNAPSINAQLHIRDDHFFSSLLVSDSNNQPVLDIGPTAHIGIGKYATEYDLDVSGNLNTYELLKNGELLRYAVSSATFWSRKGRDVYYEWGNVGIGRPDPDSLLEIAAANKKPNMPFINPSITFTSAIGTRREKSYSFGVDPNKSSQFRVEESIQLGKKPPLFVAEKDRFGVGLENPKANIHSSGNAGAIFAGTFDSFSSFNIQTSSNRFFWYGPYSALYIGQNDGLSPHGGSVFRPDTIGRFTMAFGHNQVVSGNLSSALGGQNNIVHGAYATSLGGTEKNVRGDFALGLGQSVSPIHHGSFIWGDTQAVPLESIQENQFLIRAGGGIGINTNQTFNQAFNSKQFASLAVSKANLHSGSFEDLPIPNAPLIYEQSKRIYLKLIESGYLTDNGVITPKFKPDIPLAFAGAFPESQFEPVIRQFLKEYQNKDLVQFNIEGEGTAAAIKENGRLFLGTPIPQSDFRLTIPSGSVLINSPTINALVGIQNIDSDHYPMLLYGNEGIATPGMQTQHNLKRSDLALVVTELGNVGIGLFPSENSTFNFSPTSNLKDYIKDNQKDLNALREYRVTFNPTITPATSTITNITAPTTDTRKLELASGQYFEIDYTQNPASVRLFNTLGNAIAGQFENSEIAAPFTTPPQSGMLESAGAVVSKKYQFPDGTSINPENPVIVWHYAKDPLADSVNKTGAGDATPNIYFPSANLVMKDGIEHISTSGYVGLGTTEPNYLLDISNASSLQSFSGTIIDPAIQFDIDGTDVLAFGLQGAKPDHLTFKFPTIDSASKGTLSFFADRIGIFTDTPATANLHVAENSSTLASGMISGNVFVGESSDTPHPVHTQNQLMDITESTNALQFAINNKVYQWYQRQDPNDPTKKTLYRFTTLDPNAVPPIYTYTGIGLVTPNADLDVSGSITVSPLNSQSNSVVISKLLKVNNTVTMNFDQTRYNADNNVMAFSWIPFKNLNDPESSLSSSLAVEDSDLLFFPSVTNLTASFNISKLVSEGASAPGQKGPLVFWVPLPYLNSVEGVAETDLMYDAQVALDSSQPAANISDQLISQHNLILTQTLKPSANAKATVDLRTDLSSDSISSPLTLTSTIHTNGTLDDSVSYSVKQIHIALDDQLDNDISPNVTALDIDIASSIIQDGFKTGRKTVISNGGYAVGLRSDVSKVTIQQFADKGLRYPAIFVSGNVAVNQDKAVAELDVKGTLTATNFTIADQLNISTLNAVANIFSVISRSGVGIGTSSPQTALEVIGTIQSKQISVNQTLTSDTFSSDLGKFIVNSDRNVGIGTLTPEVLFDVKSTLTERPSAAIFHKHLSHTLHSSVATNAQAIPLVGLHLSIATSKNATLVNQNASNILASQDDTALTAKALDIDLKQLYLDSQAKLNGLVVHAATPKSTTDVQNFSGIFLGGPVGIGTTTPGSDNPNIKLDVVGTLRATELPPTAFNSIQETGAFDHLVISENLEILENALLINHGYIDDLRLDNIGIMEILGSTGQTLVNLTVSRSMINDRLTVNRTVSANSSSHALVSANIGKFDSLYTIAQGSSDHTMHVQSTANVRDVLTPLNSMSADSANWNQTLGIQNNQVGINQSVPQSILHMTSQPVRNQTFIASDNRTWNDVVLSGHETASDNVGVVFITGPDKSTATGSGFAALRVAQSGVTSPSKPNTGTHLVFITDPLTGDPEERIRIMHDVKKGASDENGPSYGGRIGIGLAAPQSALHVSQNTRIRDDVMVLGTLNATIITGNTVTFSPDQMAFSTTANVSHNIQLHTPLLMSQFAPTSTPPGFDKTLFVDPAATSILSYTVSMDNSIITASISTSNPQQHKDSFMAFNGQNQLDSISSDNTNVSLSLRWDIPSNTLIASTNTAASFSVISSSNLRSTDPADDYRVRHIDALWGTKTRTAANDNYYKGVHLQLSGTLKGSPNPDTTAGIQNDKEIARGLTVSFNNIESSYVFPNGSQVKGNQYAATFLAGPLDSRPNLTKPSGIVGISSSANGSDVRPFIPSASLHIQSAQNFQSSPTYYSFLIETPQTVDIRHGNAHRGPLWINHKGTLGLSSPSIALDVTSMGSSIAQNVSDNLRLALNGTDKIRISNAAQSAIFTGNADGKFAINAEPTSTDALFVNGHVTANAFHATELLSANSLSMMDSQQKGFLVNERGFVGVNVSNPTAQLDAAYVTTDIQSPLKPHIVSINLTATSPEATAVSIIVTSNPGALLSADSGSTGRVTGIRFNGAGITDLASNVRMVGMRVSVNSQYSAFNTTQHRNDRDQYAAYFNGRVGIGTSTPQTHLDVAGAIRAHTISVNGEIDINAAVATINNLAIESTTAQSIFHSIDAPRIDITGTLNVRSMSENLLKYNLTEQSNTLNITRTLVSERASFNRLVLPRVPAWPDTATHALLIPTQARFESLTISSPHALTLPSLHLNELDIGGNELILSSNVYVTGNLALKESLRFAPTSNNFLNSRSEIIASEDNRIYFGAGNQTPKDLQSLVVNNGAKKSVPYIGSTSITGNVQALKYDNDILTVSSNVTNDLLVLTSTLSNTDNNAAVATIETRLSELLTSSTGVTINAMGIVLRQVNDTGYRPTATGLRVSIDASFNTNSDALGGYYLPDGTYVSNKKYAARFFAGTDAKGTVLMSDGVPTPSMPSAALHVVKGQNNSAKTNMLMGVSTNSGESALAIMAIKEPAIPTYSSMILGNPLNAPAILHVAKNNTTLPWLSITDTNLAPVFKIDNNGNVGIASSNIAHKLGVQGGLLAATANITGNTTAGSLSKTTAGSLSVGPANAPTFVVLNNGLSGINTTAPSAQLDVQHPITAMTSDETVSRISGTITQSDSTSDPYNVSGVSILITPTANQNVNSSGLVTGLNIDLSELTLSSGSAARKTGLYVTVNSNITPPDRRFPAIFANGFVGIGTTTPATHLAVNGTVSANNLLLTASANNQINVALVTANVITSNSGVRIGMPISGTMEVSSNKRLSIQEALTVNSTLKLDAMVFTQKSDYIVSDNLIASVYDVTDNLRISSDSTVGRLNITGNMVVNGELRLNFEGTNTPADYVYIRSLEAPNGTDSISVKSDITTANGDITAKSLNVEKAFGFGSHASKSTNQTAFSGAYDAVFTNTDSGLFTYHLRNDIDSDSGFKIAEKNSKLNIFGYSENRHDASNLYYYDGDGATRHLYTITGSLKGTENTVPVYKQSAKTEVSGNLYMQDGFTFNGSSLEVTGVAPNITITNNIDLLTSPDSFTHLNIQSTVPNVGDTETVMTHGLFYTLDEIQTNLSDVYFIGLDVTVPTNQTAALFYGGSSLSSGMMIDTDDGTRDAVSNRNKLSRDHVTSLETEGPAQLFMVTRLSSKWPSMTFVGAGNQKVRIVSANMYINNNDVTGNLKIRGDGSNPIVSVETNTGQSSFFVTRDGKIGLGTTNPEARLHIVDTTTPYAFNVNDQLVFTNTHFLGVGLTDPTAPLTVKGSVKFTTSGSSSVKFFHYNDAANGGVEIGDISGDPPIDGLLVKGNLIVGEKQASFGPNSIGIGHATDKGIAIDANTGDAQKITSIGNPLNITGPSGPVMTLLNDGNIGIGTTTPANKLEVVGNGSDVFKFSSSTTYIMMNAAGQIGINTDTPGYDLAVNGTMKISNNLTGDTLNVNKLTNESSNDKSFFNTATLDKNETFTGFSVSGVLSDDVTTAIELNAFKISIDNTDDSGRIRNSSSARRYGGLFVDVDSLKAVAPTTGDGLTDGNKYPAVFLGHPVIIGADAVDLNNKNGNGSFVFPKRAEAQLNVYPIDYSTSAANKLRAGTGYPDANNDVNFTATGSRTLAIRQVATGFKFYANANDTIGTNTTTSYEFTSSKGLKINEAVTSSATELLAINGDMKIKGTETTGYGPKLFFSGHSDTSDEFWMSHFKPATGGGELHIGFTDSRTTDPGAAFSIKNVSFAILSAVLYGEDSGDGTKTPKTGVMISDWIDVADFDSTPPSTNFHVYTHKITDHITDHKTNTTHYPAIIDQTTNQANGLAIRLNAPSDTASFVGFFASVASTTEPLVNIGTLGADHKVGQIRASNGNGAVFEARGADYAEYLPKADRRATFSTGDVVGVHNGQLKRVTQGADQILIVSNTAIVAGNYVPNTEDYELVAFLGQVPVTVDGPVAMGDWIVPSGQDDGKAIALNDSELDQVAPHHIIGRAIDTKPGQDGQVRVMIGFSDSIDPIIAQLQKMEALKSQLASFKTENASLAHTFTSITDQNAQLIQTLRSMLEDRP